MILFCFFTSLLDDHASSEHTLSRPARRVSELGFVDMSGQHLLWREFRPGPGLASAGSAHEYGDDLDRRTCSDNHMSRINSQSTTYPSSENSTGASSTAVLHNFKSRQHDWRSTVSACMIDPFGSLPIEVDQVTNQLLQFYGQHSYWQTAYALSPSIKTSIKGSWEYHASISKSHFHVLMARSALHQLRMNRWAATTTRKNLQLAAAKHQAEAITILREKVVKGSETDLTEILTSVISLATFESRYGTRTAAMMHFKAAQDLFRRIGIGSGFEDRLREEQALWFEGLYTDPGASFMWSEEEVGERVQWLIRLVDDVDHIWRGRTFGLRSQASIHHPFVARGSRLQEFLSRDTTGRVIGAYGDINETAIQQRCLLIIVTIIVTLFLRVVGRKHRPTMASRYSLMFSAVGIYTKRIERLLIEKELGEDQALADLLWMMLQNFRNLIPKGSETLEGRVLKDMDFQRCHWHACGIANVVKYLPDHRHLTLRDWLLDFVTGATYRGNLKMNGSGFSYADVGEYVNKK